MSPSGTVRSVVAMPRTDRSAYRAATTQRAGRALARRDAGVRRVSSITRKIGVGLVAAVAAVGIYVSRAVPGHSSGTRQTTGTTTSGPTASTATPPGGTASSGSPATTPAPGAPSGSSTAPTGSLAPPASPPVHTHQQAPVVSGST